MAALTTAAALVACGDQAPTDPLLDSPLAILDGERNGDDSRVDGRLELRGDCLYLASVTGALALLVFAREGLDWDAKLHVVRIGAAEFAVGQNVRFGGSFMRSAPSLSGVDWLNPPASKCDTSLVWFVGR